MIMVAAALPVTDDQRRELDRMAASSVLPHRQVVQARALVWAADGVANEEIARRCTVDSDTVRRWRTRFVERGIDGVGAIAKGRGRRSWLPTDTVRRVVELTLTGQPPGGQTHWTTRTLAAQVGVGKDTVAHHVILDNLSAHNRRCAPIQVGGATLPQRMVDVQPAATGWLHS